MDLENKEEMTVEEVAVVEESTEAPAEDAAEEKPARSRRGRGKKQKIETTEEKPQSMYLFSKQLFHTQLQVVLEQVL